MVATEKKMPTPKKKPKPTSWRKHDSRLDKTRLPDKSMYFTLYDAGAKEWNGTLIMDASDELVDEIIAVLVKHSGRRFDGHNSGVFGLLNRLDNFYRQNLIDTKKKKG